MTTAISLTEKSGVPTVDSTVIAERCGITHQAVLKMIEEHQDLIEKTFGHLGFEIRDEIRLGKAGSKSTYPVRVAFLTEQQSTFLITLFRNTEVVVEFKLALTQAFFALRDRREKVAYRGLFLLEKPTAWNGTFPPSFFKAICDCYGVAYVKGETPGFVGTFINKYVYEPLLDNMSAELKAKRQAFCEEADRSESSYKLHQFLVDNCKDVLVRQISTVETLLEISRSEMDFKEHFAAKFHGQKQLPMIYMTKNDRKKRLKKALA